MSLASSFLLECTLALGTWGNMGEAEEGELIKRSTYSYNNPIDAMVLDDTNLEEV